MNTKQYILIIGIGILIILLIVPVIFKSREHVNFEGPELSDIKYTEVFYKNPLHDLQLSGLLLIPEVDSSFPIVVFIHGSGPSYRDNKWYLSVAKHLQMNGIAVLLPDKRGCEKSEGEWIGANFEDLSTDVLSSIEFIKNQSIFNYKSIGLIGMSQGGWIAPVVSTRTTDLSFIIIMSGASVTTDEQLLYEEINNIKSYTYGFIAKLIAPITSSIIKRKDFFSPIAGFDPIPYWKNINIPVFFAYGENDQNVPVNKCVNRLKKNNLKDFTVKIYPKGEHGIIEYIDSSTIRVSAEYLDDIVAFINRDNHY